MSFIKVKKYFEIKFNSGGPQSHADLIKKIQTTYKSNQRTLSACLKELAVLEAEKLKAIHPPPKYYTINRRDGMDTDFNSVFLRNIPEIKTDTDGPSLVFLTAADEKGEKGNLILFGEERIISELGDPICSLLEGKGRGKGQRYQAKVNNLKKLPECEKLIAEYFENK